MALLWACAVYFSCYVELAWPPVISLGSGFFSDSFMDLFSLCLRFRPPFRGLLRRVWRMGPIIWAPRDRPSLDLMVAECCGVYDPVILLLAGGVWDAQGERLPCECPARMRPPPPPRGGGGGISCGHTEVCPVWQVFRPKSRFLRPKYAQLGKSRGRRPNFSPFAGRAGQASPLCPIIPAALCLPSWGTVMTRTRRGHARVRLPWWGSQLARTACVGVWVCLCVLCRAVTSGREACKLGEGTAARRGWGLGITLRCLFGCGVCGCVGV